ncbi:MAG: hypothetical protein M3O15_05700 [Acidobacteriota bacterium]|nr:hypothetical protein [Acidobacteriota bacterium]
MAMDETLIELGNLTDKIELAKGELTRQFGKGVSVTGTGTLVLDMDDSELFRRFPLKIGGTSGFADITSREGLGNPLLSSSRGLEWNEQDILQKAKDEADKVVQKEPGKALAPGQQPQFVAYHFPHVAVRYALTNGGYLYIDAVTIDKVADGGLDARGLRSRSDLTAPLGPSLASTSVPNGQRYQAQVRSMRGLNASFQASVTSADAKAAAAASLRGERKRKGEDYDIIEPFPYHPQSDATSCAPACIQMVLSYYRYQYGQAPIVGALGLDPKVISPGLLITDAFKVLRAVEDLSSTALSVEMSIGGGSLWEKFQAEIKQRRPAVVLEGAHARVVIGWCETPNPKAFPTRKLLFVDPDHPKESRQWDDIDLLNFDAAFFAQLRGLRPEILPNGMSKGNDAHGIGTTRPSPPQELAAPPNVTPPN